MNSNKKKKIYILNAMTDHCNFVVTNTLFIIYKTTKITKIVIAASKQRIQILNLYSDP